jgi:hypothetical protein
MLPLMSPMLAVTYAACSASSAGRNMLSVVPPMLEVTYAACSASYARGNVCCL